MRKRNYFILLLFVGVLCGAAYSSNQGAVSNYPVQIISERIGPQVADGVVFNVLYNDRPVVFVGQTHNLPVFQELKKWSIEEALAGRLVLILEGLPRDCSWEERFRLSKGGQGDESIYGMEDPAALLVEAGFICRNITLGIIDNYGINCPEHIVNHSSFEPLGMQVWNELVQKPADEETLNLVQELNLLIQQIQAAPDFQAKLDVFELIKKRLPEIPSYHNSAAWASLYSLYTSTALEHAYSMPLDLRLLTIELLNTEPSIPSVREWLTIDSNYREAYFAETVLWVMKHTDPSLPAVVLVGKSHLMGVFKNLAEIQASINP